MKSGYSDIAVVLDRSGSMSSVLNDTIGGFNAFLKSQKDEPGEATISLYQFDSEYSASYENVAIKEAEDLTHKTFVPRGTTALYDAIGRTVNALGEKYNKLKEDERPEKVFVVIITDGEENASHEFTFEKVKEMIEHQQSKYNWKFIFLGSELKSVNSAMSMGIIAGNSLHYANNSKGISNAYFSVSNSMSQLRSCSVEEYTTKDFFSDEDVKAQEESK